jgi:hypothetical protein
VRRAWWLCAPSNGTADRLAELGFEQPQIAQELNTVASSTPPA